MEWVVDKQHFDGFAKTFLIDGKCPYTGKTDKEYAAEGYSILNDDEYSSMVTEYGDALCGRWAEVSEEQYNNMLDILPPVGWYDGGFFVSEPYTNNIHDYYQKYHGRYYCSMQRVSTPRMVILDSLAAFVEQTEADA